ncbi:NAD(P)H oxidoreductase [Streptomyces sp. NBC_00249]|uniref:NAD(P)H oxidoreductase n=1 Tax=Streptomyces sp. NBC_00249 TaxID=2975690 RepID=UPI002250694A|nr:NAD(P)H oxidoreductase [Streptomyces sp. NBC_00249]MCX5199492.1 NAD(P)H oxidoreductase [Streptomyces sp. NBC_00249]
MSRTLLVVAHPRGDSLTAQVAERARRRAEAAGNSVDLMDLYAEGFDPRLTPQDEPDWQDREKRYSPEVHAHMRRIEEADELVVVFPVWWFAPPAVVKGWIERVWNYGFAYGRSKPRLAGKRMLWLGLAGHAAEYYESTGLGKALELQLRVGVSEFCGVGESAVRLLYGTEFSGIPETLREARAREVFAAAEEVLASFGGVGEGRVVPAAVPVGA